MNSDKCRPHRPMQGTSAFLWGDDVLRNFQFGCTGGSRAADGAASRMRRTGRKEKPRQDNGKKPKCAKFHHNHFCRCERKAINDCTARIVPNHSGFRKRKSDRSRDDLYDGTSDSRAGDRSSQLVKQRTEAGRTREQLHAHFEWFTR
jgi:hypothetical protein